MRRPRVVLTGLTCAALVALAVGCSAAEPPARPTPPDGVRFEVMQGRTDYASGTLVLRVVNESDSDLRVANAVLSWPGFAVDAEWEGTTTLASGRTVDLRTDVPALDCDAPASETAGLTLSVDLGTGPRVDITPGDPLGMLPRLHQTGCVTVLVDRIATIDLAGPLRRDGTGSDAVAVLPLRISPVGAAGTVTVSSVGSTPLLAPESGAPEWPLSLTVNAASAVSVVDLRIRPARCDPHAIAEDKIGTVLVLRVTVDGVAGDYRYAVDDDTKNALYRYVSSTCGMP